MAPSTPPFGPPSGPPPSSPPPSWTPAAEVLDSGSGAMLPPPPSGPPRDRGKAPRRVVIGIGALVGVLAVGTGAFFGIRAFFSTGPQPAEALPADTLGYLSVDLDPSGAQKIAAIQTLDKFPAFKSHVSFGARSDLRERLFDAVKGDAGCGDLDYDHDVAPWLGDRIAVAAVKTDDGSVAPVVVLQVSDAGKAKAGLTAIEKCAGSDDEDGDSDGTAQGTSGGFSVSGAWAVVAENDTIAREVTTDAAKGSLADDATYQKWTGETGDPGIVTGYAAPGAASYLAQGLDGLTGLGSSFACPEAIVPPGIPDSGGSDAYSSDLTLSDGDGDGDGEGDCAQLQEQLRRQQQAEQDQLKGLLKNFQGAALNVRFDDGSLKVETAMGAPSSSTAGLDTSKGAQEVASLPSDTAVAVGVGFDPGWAAALISRAAAGSGGAFDPQALLQQAEQATGLTFPADLETLLGSSASLSLGSDVDADALRAGPQGLPLALKVDGDPDKIAAVLEKITGNADLSPDVRAFFAGDHDGDTSVIGPDADYRSHVLAHGSLGDSATYRSVVEHSDSAAGVLYVNFDAGTWVDQLVKLSSDGFGDPSQVEANLAPLKALGVSSWRDGDVTHAQLTITTD